MSVLEPGRKSIDTEYCTSVGCVSSIQNSGVRRIFFGEGSKSIFISFGGPRADLEKL